MIAPSGYHSNNRMLESGQFLPRNCATFSFANEGLQRTLEHHVSDVLLEPQEALQDVGRPYANFNGGSF
jgi:hypothetical protein